MNLSTYLLDNSAFKGSTNYGQVVEDMYTRLTGAAIPMDLYNVLVGRMMDGNWGVDKLAIKMLKATGLWAFEDGTYGKPPAFQFQATATQPAVTTDFTVSTAAHHASAQAKVEGAKLFTEQLDTPAENTALTTAQGAASATTWLAGVTDTAPATAESAAAGVAGATDASVGATGETYMLTKDQDIIPGTAGNDTVNGLIDLVAGTAVTEAGTSTTFNGFDQINGAAGTNTFKLAVSGSNSKGDYDVSLANIEKIQVVEINNTSTGGNAITVDASTNADVTDLKVTKSTSDIELTGSDAQNITTAGTAGDVTIEGGKNIVVNDSTAAKDITVSNGTATGNAVGTITVTDTKQTTGKIVVDGGTDVTVTATSTVATGDIEVGLNQAASGAVKVVQNLNDDGSALNNAAQNIKVTGGSTVDVTVNATSTATVAGKNGALAVGTTTVTGDSKTTDVTVTQNASVTTFTTPTVAAVADQTVVTFKAMTAGQTAVVGSLTFTASKALNAEQVAAAFANLTAADTQSATGPTANGIFSGSLAAGYTSGAASGATVTFTAAATTGDTLALGGTAAPTKAFTAGSAASGGATTSNTVTLGDVVVDDHATTAAIKTITLNGFDDATLGGGGSLDALTTLNLTNSAGDTVLTSTSKTLAATLNKVSAGDLDLATNAAVETLTLTTTGVASNIDLVADALKSLTIDAGVGLTLQTGANYDDVLETVVVKGAGAVNLGNISAAGVGAGKLKSFSAADNTGGVTVSVSAKTADVHSTFTKYVLSQGNDNVTLVDATVNKAIELGAGDDTITLAAGTTALAANIDGGTGSNTLVMDSADAAGASAGTTFEAKISGFDKLSLNAVATTAQDAVDLDNLDDIKYVISAGAADTKADADVTITVTTQLAVAGTDKASITINGETVTTAGLAQGGSAAADAQTIGAALATLIGALGGGALYTAASALGVLSVTSKIDGMPLIIGPVTVAGTATDVTSANSVESSELTLDNMLDGGTLELTAAAAGTVVNMKDASGDADAFNIVTKVAAADVIHGTVTVAGVETINITASDTNVDEDADGVEYETGDRDGSTLYLTADAATTVNVTGNADLDLTLAGSDVVELVDASTLEGSLTFTASLADLVVKGGTGADDLTANADDVALYGGAGNDTLTVDGGLRVNLYGGEGADTFVISAGASSTLDAYTVINGVDSGDVIELTGATKFSASKIALSLGADETLLNYANQAIKTLAEGEMGWFQRGGNTYIVQDVTSSGTNSDAFTAGEDMIVMIVGLVDLGTGASFNTSNILEIA